MISFDIPAGPFLEILRSALRLLALLAFVPWPNPRAVPHSVRVVLALALVPVVGLPGGGGAPVPPAPEDFVRLAFFDLLLGAMLGMSLRIILAGVSAGAAIAGLSMGLTLSAVADPDTGARRDPVSRVYEWTAVALALTSGLHRRILLALADLVRLDVRPAHDGLFWLARSGAQVLEIGLRLAAPVLGVLLVADILVGLLGRLLPNLQTLAVAHPLKLLVGFSLMAAALPFAAPLILGWLHDLPAGWNALVRLP